jgi:PAS domain S-box-containing protein
LPVGSEGQSSPSSGPIKALALALGFTTLALGGLSWNALTSIKQVEDMKRRDLRIDSLRGQIVHLDEVLTMSARMAAATGDPRWEARYRVFDPQLGRAIEDALSLAPETGSTDAVARTQAANTELVRMENKAFELVRQKRLEEARATLFSEEYDRLKAVYADGMRALEAALEHAVQRAMEAEVRRLRFVLIISAAILPVLFGSWVIALRTMNRWKAMLARNQDRMSAQAAELAQLNADLERRVVERTAELERSREESLRSQERFRRLFESNTIGIVVSNPTGKALEANDAYLGMFGYTREELDAGKLSWDQMTPLEYRDRDRLALEELRQTGAAAPWEKEMLRKDGSRVPILIGVAVLHESEASRIAYIVDLSTRRQLEAQFRQAQKMEVVGQLAGGVAHDFNNLLTVIIGNGELVLGQLPSGHLAREELLEVLKAGERAAVLTRQLLAFSRKQILAPVVLDLNKVVSHLQKMLERLIGEQIELSTVLEPRLACIRADPGQLEQSIVNLVVNARDAIPGSGRITIETKVVELTKEYAQEKGYVTPGPHVRLMVSDTGTGMDAETRSRVFEPFFTTKEHGKGTGLGLSMVYGIVKQSGGSIEVESEPGQGTSVQIYFPVTAEKALELSPGRPSKSIHGTETILLVEDEDGVRSFLRRALKAEGYSVLEAPNAESAIEVARTHAGPIGLLLTDTVMPGLSGPELARQLAQTRPEMKVLFISGYTNDAVLRTSVLDANAAFLQKPFSPAALGLKVRELLREAERPI